MMNQVEHFIPGKTYKVSFPNTLYVYCESIQDIIKNYSGVYQCKELKILPKLEKEEGIIVEGSVICGDDFENEDLPYVVLEKEDDGKVLHVFSLDMNNLTTQWVPTLYTQLIPWHEEVYLFKPEDSSYKVWSDIYFDVSILLEVEQC